MVRYHAWDYFLFTDGVCTCIAFLFKIGSLLAGIAGQKNRKVGVKPRSGTKVFHFQRTGRTHSAKISSIRGKFPFYRHLIGFPELLQGTDFGPSGGHGKNVGAGNAPTLSFHTMLPTHWEVACMRRIHSEEGYTRGRRIPSRGLVKKNRGKGVAEKIPPLRRTPLGVGRKIFTKTPCGGVCLF